MGLKCHIYGLISFKTVEKCHFWAFFLLFFIYFNLNNYFSRFFFIFDFKMILSIVLYWYLFWLASIGPIIDRLKRTYNIPHIYKIWWFSLFPSNYSCMMPRQLQINLCLLKYHDCDMIQTSASNLVAIKMLSTEWSFNLHILLMLGMGIS